MECRLFSSDGINNNKLLNSPLLTDKLLHVLLLTASLYLHPRIIMFSTLKCIHGFDISNVILQNWDIIRRVKDLFFTVRAIWWTSHAVNASHARGERCAEYHLDDGCAGQLSVGLRVKWPLVVQLVPFSSWAEFSESVALILLEGFQQELIHIYNESDK